MNRTYDLFERLPDGQLLWRCCVSGPEGARRELDALARQTRKECLAIDLSTGAVLERLNYANAPSASERGTDQAEVCVL